MVKSRYMRNSLRRMHACLVPRAPRRRKENGVFRGCFFFFVVQLAKLEFGEIGLKKEPEELDFGIDKWDPFDLSGNQALDAKMYGKSEGFFPGKNRA